MPEYRQGTDTFLSGRAEAAGEEEEVARARRISHSGGGMTKRRLRRRSVAVTVAITVLTYNAQHSKRDYKLLPVHKTYCPHRLPSGHSDWSANPARFNRVQEKHVQT